jgi:hypothetical protein
LTITDAKIQETAMRYEENGIVIWYGTPDAPAPGDLIQAAPSGRAIGLTVTVGLQPIAARNAVEVRYRVGLGAERKVQAWLARTDFRARAQYFVAQLPEFSVGDTVAYGVVCSCAGRQTPGPGQTGKLGSSFKVVAAASPPAVQAARVVESIPSVASGTPTLKGMETRPVPGRAEASPVRDNTSTSTPSHPQPAGIIATSDPSQFASQLGLLTFNHAPLIQALQQTSGVKSMRNLMTLDSAAWSNLVSKAGVPPGIPGKTPQEQASNYTNAIVSALQAAFPTDAVAQIAVKAPSVHPLVSKFFANSPDFDIRKSHVDSYVAQHGSTAFSGISDGDKPKVAREVKRLQRIFQLSTNANVLGGLLNTGLDSAHVIANIPRKSFLTQHSESLGGLQQAAQVYDRAQFINARNMHLRMTIQEAMHGVETRVFGDHHARQLEGPKRELHRQTQVGPQADASQATPSQAPGGLRGSLVKRFPNYTELFGPFELCDCQECSSAWGAAAYLVDLLEFLGNSTPNASGNSPLDVLIGNPQKNIAGRRPDLAYLPLTCENTNTTMPYVDLVNEVLESYIALGGVLDASVAHDTGAATAQELDANPQYTDDQAYQPLQLAVYPFTLPFNRPVAVARAYLKHLGSSRYEVMAAFQKDQAAPVAQRGFSSEYLGLTAEEYQIVTLTSFDPSVPTPLPPLRTYYGYTSDQVGRPENNPVVTKLWKDALGDVPEFLQRTGIAYTDLVLLVTTAFINPNYPQGETFDLFRRIPFSYATLAALVQSNFTSPQTALDALKSAGINLLDLTAWSNANYQKLAKLVVLNAPDATCNLNTTRLQHLDGTLLDDPELSKLHRFIRLWHKLGWSIADLDRALTALGATDITSDVLTQLARIKQVQGSLNVSNLGVLLSLWSPINTRGDDSLYRKLFFNMAGLNKNDPDYLVFQPNSDGSVLTTSGLNIMDHIPAFLAALRVSAADLAAIRADAGLDADDAPLNLHTVSMLYRYAALAKALKLRISDLIALKTLSGSNPFTGPDQTLQFTSLASTVQSSGFMVAQLNYLYRDVSLPPANLAPQSTTILLLAKTLRDGLTKIAQDNLQVADESGDVTRGKLAMLFEQATVDQTIALINGTAIYTASLAKLPDELAQTRQSKQALGIDPAKVPPQVAKKVSYDSKAGILRFQGAMSTSEQTALLGASPDSDYQAAVNRLSQQSNDFIQNALSGFLSVPDAQKNLVSTIPSLDQDLNPVLIVQLDNSGNPTTDPAHTVTTAVATDPTKATSTAIAGKFGYLLKHLLPFLVTRLSHTLAKQTVSDALKLSSAMAQALLETVLNSRATAGQRAIGDLLALQNPGLTGSYFSSTDLSGTPALQTDTLIGFGGRLATIAPGTRSVRWTGVLLAPNNGTFSFALQTNGTAQLWLDDPTTPQLTLDPSTNEWASTPIPLKAGRLYSLRLEVTQLPAQGAAVQLFWQSASIPRAIVPSANLYPGALLDAFASTFTLLHKAALFVSTFKLSDGELAYLCAPPSTALSSVDLNALPLARDPSNTEQGKQLDQNAPALFAAWQRVSNFITLRNSLPQGEVRLIDVFASSSLGDATTKLTQATGWDPQMVAVLLGSNQATQQSGQVVIVGFNLGLADLQNENWPARLQVCMRLIKRLGVSPSQLFAWANLHSDFATVQQIAQDIKKTVQAKYDEDTWLTVAKPLNDPLRDRQRAALVAYLLPRMNLTDSNQLFEYFLIDADMGVCMETSRIVQAISSVQLFVQRCLMNLEERDDDPPRSASPSQIDADQWQQWRKQYRVWQANRKVFLYPENWLESELRDDKSPFFKEFESALLQNELTTDNAETAFLNYLAKLDQVARLEIMGMYWQDVDPDTAEQVNILHVFARTFHNPHVYFYRRLLSLTTWTPWDRMQVDIQGDHLIPVIWNRRLYVFWPTFAMKATPPTASTSSICLPNQAAANASQAKAQRARDDADKADKAREAASHDAAMAWKAYDDAVSADKASLLTSLTGIEKKISSGEADAEAWAQAQAEQDNLLLKTQAIAASALFEALAQTAANADATAKQLEDQEKNAGPGNQCGSMSTPPPPMLIGRSV